MLTHLELIISAQSQQAVPNISGSTRSGGAKPELELRVYARHGASISLFAGMAGEHGPSQGWHDLVGGYGEASRPGLVQCRSVAVSWQGGEGGSVHGAGQVGEAGLEIGRTRRMCACVCVCVAVRGLGRDVLADYWPSSVMQSRVG